LYFHPSERKTEEQSKEKWGKEEGIRRPPPASPLARI